MGMDELLIEEKRYVSSKRAAKVTGYAKDYIGQLCREGRVPARLVGRNWYVLESAIHDHRFGKEGIEPAPVSTWESPRYEASPVEILPSVNRLRDEVQSTSSPEQDDTTQHLQDSWREWFDRITDTKPDTLSVAEDQEQEEEEAAVEIPIHTVYELPPEDLLPNYRVGVSVSKEIYKERIPKESMRGTYRAIKLSGALFAVVMAALAVVGTGYFDERMISSGQVGLLAGVSAYNK